MESNWLLTKKWKIYYCCSSTFELFWLNNCDALYFSRLPIPHASKNLIDYNHHIGVYAFLKQSLIEFANLKRLNLEIIENLEGNRVVENSKKIRMVSTDFHGLSIDTPEDLLKAEKFISLND